MPRFELEHLLNSRIGRRRLLIGAGAMTSLALATQFSRRVIAQPGFPTIRSSLVWHLAILCLEASSYGRG